MLESRPSESYSWRAMRLPVFLVLATLAACGLTAPAAAQFGDDVPAVSRLVRLQASADVDAVGPGQKFHLAFAFYITRPHWHIYWQNPGMTGMPTKIEIEGPDGFEIGEMKWARPLRIDAPEGLTYGYESYVVLFVPVTAPAEQAEQAEDTAKFTAKINFLVCKEICLMGNMQRDVFVPLSAEASDAAANVDKKVLEARRHLPKKLEKAPDTSIRFDGATLVIAGPAEGHKKVAFFPGEKPGVTFGEAKIAVENDAYEIRVAVELDENNSLGEEMTLTGLVALGKKQTDPSYEFELPPEPPDPQDSKD